MDCIENIINTKADLKRFVNTTKTKKVAVKKGKKQKKPSTFFNAGVNMSMVINLFTDKNGIDKTERKKILNEPVKELVRDGKTIIPSFWKKVRGLGNLNVNDMTMFKNKRTIKDDDIITGLNTIQRGIAMYHLSGAVKTEYDLMDKYNLSKEERRLIKPDGEILPGIGANGILAAIGKDVLASQGIFLAPKKHEKDRKQAQFEVEKTYSDAGMKAVRLLAKDNFLTIEKSGDGNSSPKVINRGFKKPNGEPLSKSNVIDGIVIRFNMDKMLNLEEGGSNKITEGNKRLIQNFFKKKTGSIQNNLVADQYASLFTNTKAATFMHRLLVPTNSMGPDTEYKKNHQGHDTKISNTAQGVLDQKQKGSLVIPNELAAMFDFIFDRMEAGDGMSFEEAAKTLGINEYKEMMGYLEESDSTQATRDSNMGKSLSKTTPLQEFFDNYASIKNMPLHIREEVKRNGRGHYMSTYMNPQTDKHFSRYVMQIPPYEIPAFDDKGEMSSVFNHMLAGIADQAGVDVETILGNNADKNDKSARNLDKIIASYSKTNTSDGSQMFRFISQAFKKYPTELNGSVWQKYDSVKAIYDIRKMLAENPTGKNVSFKGTFMPKPDGTASGAVIMSMQMLGKNVNNESLFDALGLGKKEGTLKDAYDVVLNVLAGRRTTEGKQGLETEITETFNFFNDSGIYASLRDLAKVSSMTVMYSQGEKSSINTVGKQFAEDTYRFLENNRQNYAVAEKMLEWIGKTNPELHAELKGLKKTKLVEALLENKNSVPVYDAIYKYMTENVTNELFNITEQNFVEKYLSEHKNKTKEIFSEMKRLYDKNTHRITLISPEVLFDATRSLADNKDKPVEEWRHLNENELKDLTTKSDGSQGHNGVPLMKMFETTFHAKSNATISRWEFPHEINANVNIVHSLDFAILTEAFKRTFDDSNLGTKAENELLGNLDLVKNGTMSIHDAISAHPVFSEAFQGHYRKAARDINMIYDIHDMMTYEMSRMEGYGGKGQETLRSESITAKEKKAELLKDMKFDSKRVFGFNDVKASPITFGQPIISKKAAKEAEAENKKSDEELENKEMLTSYVSVKEAKKSYDKVKKVTADTHVVLDTETVGDDSTPTKQIDPTMPYQVAFTKREKQADGSFEDKDYEFWFTHKVSKQVAEHVDLEKNVSQISDKVKEQKDKGFKNNSQTFAALKEALGDTPIVAFNAEFDIESLRILYDKYNGLDGAEFNTGVNDSLGAAAHYAYTLKNKERGANNLAGSYERMTSKAFDGDAHNAMYDVHGTIEINNVMANDTLETTARPEPTPEPEAEPEVETDAVVEEAKKIVTTSTHPVIEAFRGVPGFINKFVNNGDWRYTPSDHKISVSDTNLDGMSTENSISHEILHFFTTGFLQTKRGQNLVATKYANVVLRKLGDSDKFKEMMNQLGKYDEENDTEVQARFDYFANPMKSEEDKLAEMISILGGEPETAKVIYNTINLVETGRLPGGRLKKAIDKIINEVMIFTGKITGKDATDLEVDGAKIDITKLATAISVIAQKGKEFNKKKPKAAAKARAKADKAGRIFKAGNDSKKSINIIRESLKYSKNGNADYVVSDPVSRFIESSNEYVADLLYLHLGDNAAGIAKLGARYVDDYLMENSSMYESSRGFVLDAWESKTMQGIKAYLVPSMVNNRDKLHEMARKFQEANQEHGKITTTEVTKLDNMMKDMSKAEIAKLNDMFAHNPMFMLINNGGIIHDIAAGSTTVEAEISKIEQRANRVDIKNAKSFADLFIDGEPTGDSYNMHIEGTTAKRSPDIQKLTALYGLQKIDGSEKALKDIYINNKDLYNKLVETSRALEFTTDEAYKETGDSKRYRGNMTLEYYENPFEMKAVPQKDINNGVFNVGTEWKTLIPSVDNHGIAVLYRTGQDSQYQEGFGTNIDYGNTDIFMPREYKHKGGMKGLVEFGTGKNKRYKVIIPMSKKKELGLIQNPAHTMLRSYAHIEKIRQTQAIREEIASNSGLRYNLMSADNRDTDPLLKLMAEKEKEPWFIQMEPGTNYDALPDKVKKRFSPIPVKVSSIGGLNKKISLVRNDIGHWLVGYERALPFENIPELRKTFQVITQAVALMKIHMIIVNPAKVTLDAISTTTLLVSNGVSPLTIAKGWKRNMGLMKEMSSLRSQQVDLTIRARGGNKTAERKLKRIEKELRDHPLMGAINAGVMQSLTTDIITRDYDTITGLQRNIEKVLNNISHDKNNLPNNFHKAVVKFSKFGFNIEDLFAKMADMGKDSDSFKHMAEEIGIMGERIEKIKKEEDVAKYLSEFFASPSSTLTKLGSVATTYPDAMSRIIYRDHLIANWSRIIPGHVKMMMRHGSITEEKGNRIIDNAKNIHSEKDMNDEEISLLNTMVSDFMPDYTYAPPMILDATGRFFITPFVSYSARIQRVILNLAERNPLTFFGSLILADAFGLEPGDTQYHVVGSNYITREEFINNVFTDLIDMQTILPVNVLNLDIID